LKRKSKAGLDESEISDYDDDERIA